jgi:hypothetical protein
MEPTNKSNPIESMLTSVFGVDRVKTITESFCVSCDSKDNNAASFRDDLSRKEYAISGMCQSCQDDIFGVGDDDPDDEDWPDDEPPEMSDVEADADTLASAGMGTDEDYGYSGDLDHF